MNNSLLTVPQFIEAGSKQELVRFMLALQTRVKMKLHFFDIQKDGKKWVAWYEIDLKPELLKAKVGE